MDTISREIKNGKLYIYYNCDSKTDRHLYKLKHISEYDMRSGKPMTTFVMCTIDNLEEIRANDYKDDNITIGFKNEVVNNCHSMETLYSHIGKQNEEIIRRIIRTEAAKQIHYSRENLPKKIGFSKYGFHSGPVILVHDLSKDTEHPIIEVLKFYSKKNDENKSYDIPSLKEYLEDISSRTTSNTGIYCQKHPMIRSCVDECICVNYPTFFDFGKKTYCSKSSIEKEILTRHKIIKSRYTAATVKEFRKILVLKNFA